MIKTAILLTTVLLPVQDAQVCNSQCNRQGQCTSYCYPVYRNYPRESLQQRYDNDYNRRAYEYELRLLDRENRR